MAKNDAELEEHAEINPSTLRRNQTSATSLPPHMVHHHHFGWVRLVLCVCYCSFHPVSSVHDDDAFHVHLDVHGHIYSQSWCDLADMFLFGAIIITYIPLSLSIRTRTKPIHMYICM